MPERQAFRDAINAYNEMDAISRGVMFIPVGWEQTLPGMGRPQSLINEDLRDCDYFVLILWDRWGSSSGDAAYTSATSEEYAIARECWNNSEHCLREIAAFFKAAEPRQMSDPGEQLRNVLDFKRQLEQPRSCSLAPLMTFRCFNGSYSDCWQSGSEITNKESEARRASRCPACLHRKPPQRVYRRQNR